MVWRCLVCWGIEMRERCEPRVLRLRYASLNEAGHDFSKIEARFYFCGDYFAAELDALFEDVEGDVGFLLVDDEGRAEADAGLAAAEDQEAAFEGEVDDRVAQRAGGVAGLLGL